MSIATKAATATLALQGQSRIEASAPPPSSRDSVLANSPTVRRTAEVRFDAGSGEGNRPGSHAAPKLQPSDDSRYVRFVEAVQALRINMEQTTLPPAQIERMMESAREIFQLDDGVPRPVRPPEPAPPSPADAAGAAEDAVRPDAADDASPTPREPDAGAGWEPVKAPPAPNGAGKGAAADAAAPAGDTETAGPDAASISGPAPPVPATGPTAPPPEAPADEAAG